MLLLLQGSLPDPQQSQRARSACGAKRWRLTAAAERDRPLVEDDVRYRRCVAHQAAPECPQIC